MSVKRYELLGLRSGYHEFPPMTLVAASDYDALAARLAEAEALIVKVGEGNTVEAYRAVDEYIERHSLGAKESQP